MNHAKLLNSVLWIWYYFSLKLSGNVSSSFMFGRKVINRTLGPVFHLNLIAANRSVFLCFKIISSSRVPWKQWYTLCFATIEMVPLLFFYLNSTGSVFSKRKFLVQIFKKYSHCCIKSQTQKEPNLQPMLRRWMRKYFCPSSLSISNDLHPIKLWYTTHRENF